MSVHTKWTQTQLNKLVELYPQTLDWDTLLQMFPFSTKRGIQAQAAKLNLRKPRLVSNYTNKYNHALFDKWNEKSIYILGYLEADGCLNFNKNKNTFTFATSEKDIEFLQLLHKTVGSTGKISKKTHHLSDGSTHNSYSFVVSSQQWKLKVGHLLRQEEIPSKIPESLIHHYIRGYFDGDGSIYFDQQTQNYKSNLVFNSEELANSFRNKILQQNILVSNIHKKTNSQYCWYFQLSYHQTKKLGGWMYKDSNLYLHRKYQLFQRQQELYNN